MLNVRKAVFTNRPNLHKLKSDISEKLRGVSQTYSQLVKPCCVTKTPPRSDQPFSSYTE